MSSLAPAALETAMRGTVTAPGDPDYDERRKLYNAMIDRRPALIARCTDAADVIAAVGHARSEGMPLAVRGGGHNGARPGQRRRRPGDRPLGDARRDRRPGVEGRARARRVAAGRRRPRVPPVRPRAAERDHLHDRRRRHHARRRARPPHPRRRPDDRQPDRGRRRARRRPARAHERVGAARPVLGAARRRRQLRRRRVVLVHAAGGRRRARRARRCGRWRRRRPSCAPSTPTWRRRPTSSAASSCSSRCRRARRSRSELHGRKMCGIAWCVTDPDATDVFDDLLAAAKPDLHGVAADAVPGLELRLRRPLPARAPVVLARGLRLASSPTRRSPLHCEHGAKLPTMQSSMHMYPINGAAGAGRQGRHGVGLPRRASTGSVIVGVDPDPAKAGLHARLDRRLPRGAAPVLDGRRLREHDDGRGPGAGARELPRPLRPARRRSRRSTTRRTSSGSTRTSPPPRRRIRADMRAATRGRVRSPRGPAGWRAV